MMKRVVFGALALAALWLPVQGQEEIPEIQQKMVTLPSGVKYVDLVKGTGPTIVRGQKVTVEYEGTLEETGETFDSSYKRGEPMSYYHLANNLIPGWNEGVTGMKVGGKRKIIIPPAYGYGASGSGDNIPPNATLIFVIHLKEAGEVLSRP